METRQVMVPDWSACSTLIHSFSSTSWHLSLELGLMMMHSCRGDRRVSSALRSCSTANTSCSTEKSSIVLIFISFSRSFSFSRSSFFGATRSSPRLSFSLMRDWRNSSQEGLSMGRGCHPCWMLSHNSREHFPSSPSGIIGLDPFANATTPPNPDHQLNTTAHWTGLPGRQNRSTLPHIISKRIKEKL